MANKPDCRNCVQLYEDEETPCDKCIPLKLMPQNEDAYRVYLHTRRNLEISPSGQILDIKKEAITATLTGLEIKNKPSVFEKVSMLARHMIEEELI